MPSVFLGDVLEHLKLPSCHLLGRQLCQRIIWPRSTYRAGTNIANLSTFNYIIECFHNLLWRNITIHSVNLQNIDVGAQSFDTLIHCIKNVLSREADSVDARTIVTGESCRIYRAFFSIDELEALGHNDQL